jgi:sec-independent protein translocase protein TatB
VFNVNGWELVILAVIALIVFGPERLPEVAAQVGKLLREVRQAADSATAEFTRELEAAAREAKDLESDLRDLPSLATEALKGSPSPERDQAARPDPSPGPGDEGDADRPDEPSGRRIDGSGSDPDEPET